MDVLFIVAPIVCGDSVFDPCFFLFSTLFPSSFAIILIGKKELVALLQLSSSCIVTDGVL